VIAVFAWQVQHFKACGGKIAVSFFQSFVAVKICRLWR